MNFKKLATSLKGKLLLSCIVPIICLLVFIYFSLDSSNKLGLLLERDHRQIISNLVSYGDILTQRAAIGYYTLQAVGNHGDVVRVLKKEKLRSRIF